MKPPQRPSERDEPDDDESLPVGQLQARLLDPELHADIARSDVVLGVHPVTGERGSLFYGIAAVKRVIRRGKDEEWVVLELPVDPATDDVEVACVLVKDIKGAHCYRASSRPPRD
jgi:hypothetical protein